MNPTLIILGLMIIKLSLTAFGGGYTIYPELERGLVEVHHWLTKTEFYQLFAIAQSAPGPNTVLMPLIGWRLGGIEGLLIATFSGYIPGALLTFFAMKGWDYFKQLSWYGVIKRALIPLTIGLLTASSWTIAKSVAPTLTLTIILLGSVILSFRTRLHPLIILGCGGGMAGIIEGY